MLKLAKVQNAAKAPRADASIEVGHAYWGGTAFGENFTKEFQKSFELLETLKIPQRAGRVSISVLIDDKRMSQPADEIWMEQQLNELHQYFDKVDYIVFESQLKNWLSTFYRIVQADRRNSIERDMERYVSSKRTTACSHDIAIWHAMRSGALGYANLPVYSVEGRHSGGGLIPSFCAPRIISILNQNDRIHEEDAEIEVLRHVRPETMDWRNIERNYYYL